MDEDILVNEYRGDLLENVLRGRMCIINEKGNLIYHQGDIYQPTYYRSSSKPIQALPFLLRDLDEKYQLTSQEIAIMGGSHIDEDIHEEVLMSLLDKMELQEVDLVMNPSYSVFLNLRDQKVSKGIPPRKIAHNCAGKHLALMALARELTGTVEGYWRKNNPAQKEIISCIAQMANYPEEKIKIGVDGCGVPVYAVGLYHIALSFLRLGHPELIDNKMLAKAAAKMSQAMNIAPQMIAGTNQICTLLNEDPNINAKGGAMGVYAFTLKKERMGIAFKIESGVEYMGVVVKHILKELHYSNENLMNKLDNFYSGMQYNTCGNLVGEIRSEFILKKDKGEEL